MIDHLTNGYPCKNADGHDMRVKFTGKDDLIKDEFIYQYLLMIKNTAQFDSNGLLAKIIDYSLQRMNTHHCFNGIYPEAFEYTIKELLKSREEEQIALEEAKAALVL